MRASSGNSSPVRSTAEGRGRRRKKNAALLISSTPSEREPKTKTKSAIPGGEEERRKRKKKCEQQPSPGWMGGGERARLAPCVPACDSGEHWTLLGSHSEWVGALVEWVGFPHGAPTSVSSYIKTNGRQRSAPKFIQIPKRRCWWSVYRGGACPGAPSALWDISSSPVTFLYPRVTAWLAWSRNNIVTFLFSISIHNTSRYFVISSNGLRKFSDRLTKSNILIIFNQILWYQYCCHDDYLYCHTEVLIDNNNNHNYNNDNNRCHHQQQQMGKGK